MTIQYNVWRINCLRFPYFFVLFALLLLVIRFCKPFPADLKKTMNMKHLHLTQAYEIHNKHKLTDGLLSTYLWYYCVVNNHATMTRSSSFEFFLSFRLLWIGQLKKFANNRKGNVVVVWLFTKQLLQNKDCLDFWELIRDEPSFNVVSLLTRFIINFL